MRNNAYMTYVLIALILYLSFSPSLSIDTGFNYLNITSERQTCSVYNEVVAKQLTLYTGAAYCCGLLGKGCEQWNCPICSILPMQNLTVIKNASTDANGFVGYNPLNNTIIVTFSGTNPHVIQDWINDLDAIMVEYTPPSNIYSCPGCQVHKGFYLAYLSIEAQVWTAVRKLHRKHWNARVQITGHSLGAALALHCAIDLSLNLKLATDAVYTLGQPRVGNTPFANFIDKHGPTVWRITHARDPVPHVPVSNWGFHHVNREIFYPNDTLSHRLCDGGENVTCSDQYDNLTNTSLNDHYLYLDFNYTKCGDECQH